MTNKIETLVFFVLVGVYQIMLCLWWLSSKESVCNIGDAGDMSSIPIWGGSSEGGSGNPLEYSCLGNPTD